MKSNIVLVGLGPHAKRIYLTALSEKYKEPELIIDLKSKEAEVRSFLKQRNVKSDVYFVDDKFAYLKEIPDNIQKELLSIMQKKGISHAIIATEPKAHYSYIKFFLQNRIRVLVDKPLTAPCNVSTDSEAAKEIYSDFKNIVRLNNLIKGKDSSVIQVMCQRRWHRGYIYVYELIKKIILQYNVPVTSMQISHCDGMWNMPDEFLFRENHPYKYGYGKLLHSGYHFIDLASWFISLNNILENKKTDRVELYSTCVRPDDFLSIIDKNDYVKLFGIKPQRYDAAFDKKNKMSGFGEIDTHCIMQFFNKESVISTVTMDLMQNGFSRRSWSDLPEDTYKHNGRVRHEYMNIQIGPLMNIKIESYQAKEVKDRIVGKYDVGEIENFDIYIFRNVDLTGGKPVEKISLNELYGKEGFIGYNETAREQCLKQFLDNKLKGDFERDNYLGIVLLEKWYQSVTKRFNGEEAVVRFNY